MLLLEKTTFWACFAFIYSASCLGHSNYYSAYACCIVCGNVMHCTRGCRWHQLATIFRSLQVWLRHVERIWCHQRTDVPCGVLCVAYSQHVLMCCINNIWWWYKEARNEMSGCVCRLQAVGWRMRWTAVDWEPRQDTAWYFTFLMMLYQSKYSTSCHSLIGTLFGWVN